MMGLECKEAHHNFPEKWEIMSNCGILNKGTDWSLAREIGAN
jgi:hypothetical protein